MKRMIAFTSAIFIAFTLQAAAWEIGDDGLHKEEWFSLTFKDIAEDIATAKENGKRLALIVEQRGCIYCKEVHEVVLADPEVRDYIKEHFMVVQYNMHGSEEVTDTDGETLTEKQAAKKWRLLFTPTRGYGRRAGRGGDDARRFQERDLPGNVHMGERQGL